MDLAYPRISIEVSKAQNDIPSAKRDGDDMAKNVRNFIHLDENVSSTRATSTLRQETLLDELDKALDHDEDDVVAKFEELRAECTCPLISAELYSDQSGKAKGECDCRCIGITHTCFRVGRFYPFKTSTLHLFVTKNRNNLSYQFLWKKTRLPQKDYILQEM
jgi:hypothetical protein